MNAKTLYDWARVWVEVAQVLGQNNINHGLRLTFPSIVCDAFAVELSLKCLLTLELKQYGRTHSIQALFDGLSESSRV